MRDQPNILFIMADQFRLDALGCVGGWARTPNLDRLAREGVLFDQCHTASPLCVPARMALATGRYPHNTGVWDNYDVSLAHGTPTWMAAIRQAGFRTSLFGKTHLHKHSGDLREREPLMNSLGLDDVDEIGGPHAATKVLCHMTARWESLGLWSRYKEDYKRRAERGPFASPSALPLEEYADVYVGTRASRYLADYSHDKPWFCWVSFGGPHEPWDAPEPYASMYDPAAMPAPRKAPAEPFDRPPCNFDSLRRPGFIDGQIAGLRANYAGNVTLIDEQIGQILKVVEQRGELDNTVVVFTSDHGEMNGDAGLLYKSNFLDAAMRVPLIFRSPGTLGAGKARVDSSLVEWIDIGATLTECAGGSPLDHSHARSFLHTVSDPLLPHRADVLAELKREFMLATSEWKIVLNKNGQAAMLFDRAGDPHESRNLAGDPMYAPIRDQLRLRVLDRLAQSQLPVPADVTG